MLAASVMATAMAGLPAKVSGLYCLVADDTVANYTSTDTWTPKLYPYQEDGGNVYFLTFINPELLPSVPPAMKSLAGCRGQSGCPGKDSKVLLSVGGQAYSNKAWSWLASASTAEAMATKVSTEWASLGVDGIDLDIEGSAGGSDAASTALLAFVKKLRSLQPGWIITQPVYGYPQVKAENYMVNTGWDNTSKSLNTIDSVGIMVYQGLQSLNYVKNYDNATHQWQGFPIHVDVPSTKVLAGLSGSASDGDIMSMAKAVKAQDLGGFMVWFASVYDNTRSAPAFTYGNGQMDSSKAKSSAWAEAIKAMQ
eukprot:Hpha_TRINITY_DN8687_c0_g1::TRINITY_DN8687_c0_g1_i1::g.168872::m.168872/K01183/E3.2.1.14; chitinase